MVRIFEQIGTAYEHGEASLYPLHLEFAKFAARLDLDGLAKVHNNDYALPNPGI
jgi:hypothetical protein